ncbi:doxorubicin biosynthesis protein DnrV [Streptomyces sp. ICBB 8177]|nr:doxorubicin biosynthesis protein DnrV [Streptomyces sp. ICBB 8177]
MTGMPKECVPGAPCWVSLMARDLDAATGFYGPLFGWHFEPGPERWGPYLRVHSGDWEVAGIGAVAARWELPVAWTTYFGTDNADRTADAIRERGGTVAVGPLEFDAGRLALAADPAGASFGVWEGAQGRPQRSQPIGAPVWIQLRTRDAFASALFYGGVFAWDDADPQRYEVVWEHDRVVLRVDGHSVAALSGGGTEAAADPRVRPRWHVYFSVQDVDATVELAAKLGGEITGEPENSAYGRVAGLRDPEGGLFSLISGHY